MEGGIDDLENICDGNSKCYGITENGENIVRKCLSRKLTKSFGEDQTTYMKLEDGMI